MPESWSRRFRRWWGRVAQTGRWRGMGRRIFVRWSTSMRSCAAIGEYNYLVRIKTSITLPKELLHRLDQVDANRSALLERAALAYLARLEAEQRARRDIDI